MAGRSGIPALDARLGPIADGGRVLIRNEPAVEGMPFLLQACGHHLERGAPVVFLVVQRPPGRVRQALRRHGHAHQGRGGLHIVDAHSALSGTRDPEAVHVGDPSDLAVVARALEDQADEHPGAVLLVDAWEALVERGAPDGLAALAAACRRFTLVIASATDWSAPGPEEGWVGLFDAEVSLRAVEDRVVLNQSLDVVRTPWSRRSTTPILYKVVQPGGVLAHVPKLVVIGPQDAGKTTFVHSLAGEAVSVERMGTTVALDRATVQLGGASVDVFGTPGQSRFDALLPALTRQATAAVLIVDATRPEDFGRAGDILAQVWRQGLTAIVALNKQDLAGALRVEEAADLLRLPDDVPIVGCTARDPVSAKAVLSTLVGRILGVQL